MMKLTRLGDQINPFLGDSAVFTGVTLMLSKQLMRLCNQINHEFSVISDGR